MNNAQQKPIARSEGLVIQEMPDEILVFDMDSNKAHCLNETAAFVWKACDGTKSVAEITKSFGSKAGKAVDENLVWLAIDQLNENNLLEQELKANFNGQSRRDVIKKIGLAAVIALPVISSLVAPTSALAVVACSNGGGTTCMVGGQVCQAGSSCTGCMIGAGQTRCVCNGAGAGSGDCQGSA